MITLSWATAFAGCASVADANGESIDAAAASDAGDASLGADAVGDDVTVAADVSDVSDTIPDGSPKDATCSEACPSHYDVPPNGSTCAGFCAGLLCDYAEFPYGCFPEATCQPSGYWSVITYCTNPPRDAGPDTSEVGPDGD